MPDIKDTVGDGATNDSEDVAIVQVMLRVIKNAKGNPYLGGHYDGTHGPITKTAISAFQLDTNLAAKPPAKAPAPGAKAAPDVKAAPPDAKAAPPDKLDSTDVATPANPPKNVSAKKVKLSAKFKLLPMRIPVCAINPSNMDVPKAVCIARHNP